MEHVYKQEGHARVDQFLMKATTYFGDKSEYGSLYFSTIDALAVWKVW